MAVVQKNNVREYKIDLDGSAGNAFYLLGKRSKIFVEKEF